MEIIHRITTNLTPEMREGLAKIGISAPKSHRNTAQNLHTFVVSEADAAWPAMQAWVKEHDTVDILRTVFTEEEIAAARWLELLGTWQHGYPQPRENDFGFREVTYDLNTWCRTCGAGAKQKAPFQMKKEPNWEENSILQLHWVHNEFFVTRTAYEKVFRHFGVKSLEVLSPFGVPLNTVVQLVVDEEVDIDAREMRACDCDVCGHAKYMPPTRGPFPALCVQPRGHMVKTRQLFGSDHQAIRGVLVSRQLAKAIQQEHLGGVTFRPVREIAADKI